MTMLMAVTRKPWYPSSPATACAWLPVIPAGKPLEAAARNADRKQQEVVRPFHSLPLKPPVRILAPLSPFTEDHGGQAE